MICLYFKSTLKTSLQVQGPLVSPLDRHPAPFLENPSPSPPLNHWFPLREPRLAQQDIFLWNSTTH